MAVKTLSIDGKAISVKADQTVLEAATEAGISIPTMCHLDGISDVGACRLCLVEVGATNRLLPACTTKVYSSENCGCTWPLQRAENVSGLIRFTAGVPEFQIPLFAAVTALSTPTRPGAPAKPVLA